MYVANARICELWGTQGPSRERDDRGTCVEFGRLTWSRLALDTPSSTAIMPRGKLAIPWSETDRTDPAQRPEVTEGLDRYDGADTRGSWKACLA